MNFLFIAKASQYTTLWKLFNLPFLLFMFDFFLILLFYLIFLIIFHHSALFWFIQILSFLVTTFIVFKWIYLYFYLFLRFIHILPMILDVFIIFNFVIADLFLGILLFLTFLLIDISYDRSSGTVLISIFDFRSFISNFNRKFLIYWEIFLIADIVLFVIEIKWTLFRFSQWRVFDNFTRLNFTFLHLSL